MSLSKSKCWYLNNCLHLLNCAVPLCWVWLFHCYDECCGAEKQSFPETDMFIHYFNSIYLFLPFGPPDFLSFCVSLFPYFCLSVFLFFCLSRLKTQGSRLKTQDSRLKTQDSRLKTQDSRLKSLDPRPKTQDSSVHLTWIGYITTDLLTFPL